MGWIIRLLRTVRKDKKTGKLVFGKWYSRIEHINGEVLYSSETYSSFQACEDTVDSLKRGVKLEFWQKIVETGVEELPVGEEDQDEGPFEVEEAGGDDSAGTE